MSPFDSSLRRSYFFHTDGTHSHWDEEPIGALYRLDASYHERAMPVPHNALYKLVDSNWEPIDDAAAPHDARGLQWTIWATNVAGRQLVACRGLRMVDEDTLSLLENLTVFAQNGEVLEDLLTAGQTFLLNLEEFAIFKSRLAKMGGNIFRGAPSPNRVTELLRECEVCLNVLRELKRQDIDALNKINVHNYSELPEFEGRGSAYRKTKKNLATLISDLDREATLYISSGVGQAEQDAVEEMMEAASAMSDQMQMIFEEREQFQRTVSKARNKSARKAKAKPVARASENTLLIRSFARMASSLGHRVVTDEESETILIDGYELYLESGKLKINRPD